MNRRTLFGRFAALQSANRAATRQDYFRPLLEPLEDRKMLAASTMLSHNFVDVDPTFDGTHLNSNDQVQDSVTLLVFNYAFTGFGDVTNAVDPANPANHFLAGDETLHDAVAATPSAAQLQISDGTYAASDVILGNAITVFGNGANTVIVPEVASDKSEFGATQNLGHAGAGASGAHQGLIINAQNVTISNLTMDGNLGGVGGSLNYQQGISTLFDLAQDGNAFYSAFDYKNPGTPIQVPLTPLIFGTGNPTVNMVVDTVTVNNTFFHGIAMSSYFNNGAWKNMQIINSTVNNVGGGSTAADSSVGILMRNMDNGVINHDTIGAGGAAVGIQTIPNGPFPLG
ncbi:MAG: hypothetical protein HY288_19380, partial [Planctomycetia bacterium]|nr:hypothetical protein [Planctomycetia bacterium]